MIAIRTEMPSDVPAREALLDAAFGAARWRKSSEPLRAGRRPAEGLSFCATRHGRVVGTVRLWNVAAGHGCPALLLGPLAVAHDARGIGIGAALVRHALAQARRRGHRAVLLVGDAGYYARLGFAAEPAAQLRLADTDRHRLLAHELVPGALAQAQGVIVPTGRRKTPRTAVPAAQRKAA